MTELAGMAEAAEIVGISKSNFTGHRRKYAEEGQCPPPTGNVKAGPIWVGRDVDKLRKWAKEFAKIRPPRPVKKEDVAEAAPAKPKKAAAAKPVTAPAKKTIAKPAAAAKKAPAKVTPLFGKKG